MASGAYDEEDQYTCSIHLDIMVDPVVLPLCGHWFCKECIRMYVYSKTDTDPDCPECRVPLDLEDGVDGLMVNHKMREICRSLESKKQAKDEIPRCTKHPNELLNRFCCECLVPVCEDCAEEEHSHHRCRSLGSAWRVVGPVIEERFRYAREKLQANRRYHTESERRKDAIIEQSESAYQSIIRLRDQLSSNIEETSERLMEQVSDRVDRDLALEEELSLMDSSQDLPTSQDLERSERCLQRILSSKDNHYVTKSDLDAILDLHQLQDIAEIELPKTTDPLKFIPNEIATRLLSEGIGNLTAGHQSASIPRVGSTRGFDISRERMSMNAIYPESLSFDDERWSTMEPRQVKSIDQMICATKRIMLPDTVAQPYDVHPYLSDDKFIVADMSGAITLLSGTDTDEIRSHTLKRSTGDSFMGPSGVAFYSSIFVCNHNEKHIEQLDIQRVTCVRQIGDNTCLFSPRAITHSITKRVIYVSDLMGGVKAFDSDTGRFLSKIGNMSLLSPLGLASNLQSHLYVVDELQGRIYIFDTRMGPRDPFKDIPVTINGRRSHCYGVSLATNGHIWATATSDRSPSTSLLCEYDMDGKLLRTGGPELMKPRGLKVHDRRITVADAQEHCIVTYE